MQLLARSDWQVRQLPRRQTGDRRWIESMITRKTRFTTQLPSASPTARFGAWATVTLVMRVANAGREVTARGLRLEQIFYALDRLCQ